MTIKPVLVPDHDAAALRGLIDRFADATTGPVKRQLTESVESGVTEGVKKMSPQQQHDFDRMRYGAMSRKEYDAKWKKPLKSDDEVIYGKKKSVAEFAPPDSGDGGGDDDGFDEDTLRKLAAQWFNGDEDPQVERLLAAAGWEIGQDEGYDDEPGVFVVMSGDDNGRSYMSWPAEEMRSAMSEGVSEDAAANNPVVNAITRRIVLQRTDLLSKYGPEKIGQAVDEVADFVGDVEEIGSSDVSGWVRHVEQMLGNREPDVTEQQVDELSPKTLGSYIKKSSADAAERQGEVSGRNQFGKGAEFAVKAFYGDQIQPNPTRTDPRIAKRQAGVDQAVDRLTAEDVAPAFKPGDRVMYLNGFATVVAQDGDAYGIRIDGKPGTLKVPASQIRKPSYDESVAESSDPVEQLRADIRRFAL